MPTALPLVLTIMLSIYREVTGRDKTHTTSTYPVSSVSCSAGLISPDQAHGFARDDALHPT